ncbi:MAG: hypothetical protein AB8H80_14980 [Planctomycetota bacterium]
MPMKTAANRFSVLSHRATPLAALLLAIALGPGDVSAQDPKKIPPDPEVAERVDVLTKVKKDRKFELDAKGVDAIDVLMQKHEKGLNEKDQKAIVKALDGVLNKSKVRPPNRAQVYFAAAEALGRHAAAGAKVLQKTYDGKRLPDKPVWVPLREKLLLNVGRTRDVKMVKFLLDEARRSPEPALQASAGRALGFFDEAPEKVRKDIVGNLLVKLGSLNETASIIGNNVEAQNAQDRLAAVSGPWNETLRKLTRENIDSFREWQTWHNKNRNKKWK